MLRKLIREIIKLPFTLCLVQNKVLQQRPFLVKTRIASHLLFSLSQFQQMNGALSPFTAPHAVVPRLLVSASYFASPSAFYFKVNETNTSKFVFFFLRENQKGMT